MLCTFKKEQLTETKQNNNKKKQHKVHLNWAVWTGAKKSKTKSEVCKMHNAAGWAACVSRNSIFDKQKLGKREI